MVSACEKQWHAQQENQAAQAFQQYQKSITSNGWALVADGWESTTTEALQVDTLSWTEKTRQTQDNLERCPQTWPGLPSDRMDSGRGRSSCESLLRSRCIFYIRQQVRGCTMLFEWVSDAQSPYSVILFIVLFFCLTTGNDNWQSGESDHPEVSYLRYYQIWGKNLIRILNFLKGLLYPWPKISMFCALSQIINTFLKNIKLAQKSFASPGRKCSTLKTEDAK